MEESEGIEMKAEGWGGEHNRLTWRTMNDLLGEGYSEFPLKGVNPIFSRYLMTVIKNQLKINWLRLSHIVCCLNWLYGHSWPFLLSCICANCPPYWKLAESWQLREIILNPLLFTGFNLCPQNLQSWQAGKVQ